MNLLLSDYIRSCLIGWKRVCFWKGASFYDSIWLCSECEKCMIFYSIFFFLLSSSIFNATIYQITVIWFIFYLCFAFYMKLKWREECNRCNKIVVRQTNDVERIYWELVEEDDNEKKILKRAYVVPLCVSVVYVHQAHHEHIFGIRIIMRIFINMSWGAFHLWFHYFF